MLVDQVPAASTSKVSISTPGDSFVFNSAEAPATTTASPTLEMELVLSGNELPAYSPSEVLVSEVLLRSSSSEAVQVEFTDSCKAELWVVDGVVLLIEEGDFKGARLGHS